jgi:2-keto-4-pentenoate hydratase/2-oxohepta-3-ene-1,7-dioic acid hydratase in catechol pathway
VKCFIGEEKIADDNTNFYNYKVAEVLSFLSYFQTLSAGDVVSMGTAFKPGATRKSIHHANFLKVGGPVSIEIEGLGRQENPVIIEERELGRWRLS